MVICQYKERSQRPSGLRHEVGIDAARVQYPTEEICEKKGGFVKFGEFARLVRMRVVVRECQSEGNFFWEI